MPGLRKRHQTSACETPNCRNNAFPASRFNHLCSQIVNIKINHSKHSKVWNPNTAIVMDEDDFNIITKKPLKLASEKAKERGKIKNLPETAEIEAEQVISPTLTKAEQIFKSRQEKTSQGRIMKKAAKTHKQRVEEFNKHLDSLSEHYDIPKVSWTK